ncbi:META domain-containing protein [uncultured Brachyspira sp.]|uniref:META domain-containing protein n=1 Tax=uncultured Brachyspira sp. TaxID=221953 RepID=UPI0025D9FDBF|nr:META domain-containing protein [uncultured Brachyspira sp.]
MKYIVHIIITALFVISCSTAKTAQTAQIEKIDNNSLLGRKFKLVSMHPQMNITIEFGKDTVSGFSAVNNYSSLYTSDGDIFNIISISLTKKHGTREETAAEIEYLNMLKNATSYKIEGMKLTIYTLLSSNNLIFEEI